MHLKKKKGGERLSSVCVQVVLPASVKGASKFNAALQTSGRRYDLRIIVEEVLGKEEKKKHITIPKSEEVGGRNQEK